MQAPLSTPNALQRHPTEVAAVVADLNRKLAKAKLAPIGAIDLVWFYEWYTHISGPESGSIGLSLAGTIGRRTSFARLGELKRTDSKPPEVDAVVHPAPVITQATPHVAVLRVYNPNTRTTIDHLVVAGYRKKGVNRLLVQELGQTHDTPMLYTLTATGVYWAGGLHRTAHKALMACDEGGTWTWRRAPRQRLDSATIQGMVAGKTFALLGIDAG